MGDAREMWARGSYVIVGDWFAAASIACLDGLDLDGVRVLDVACGTGAVAIDAARRGASVVGVDLTPSMLEEAARRSNAAGVVVEWQEGSFTDLSAHRGFDVAASAFGVMFAEDQAAVAAELIATVRPGGTVRIASWAPGGAFGLTAPGILELLPGAAAGSDRTSWADPEGLSGILAHVDPDLGARVEGLRSDHVRLPFPSVEVAVQEMRRWSGPWMVLFDALEGMGVAAEGNAALVDHLSGYAEDVEDGVVIAVAYAVATVVRDFT